ncbi:hypothetical protein DPMN_012488 [Dreissena polymorpha]|uniref:Uncharacterized protein n=1 Tax=Dreissena polymorpha TaxID=45954 RepID=A0A9D4N2K1_DREPO|nr:hypothetical protein DPMN_012488 [Dreissena polymorpha]
MVKDLGNAQEGLKGPKKNAQPSGSHVFQPTGTIFEPFHDDGTLNVASRLFTRKNATPPWRKNAPPLGSHVFQANVTIFKLKQEIIETNLLTKFHEDWTIKVVSRVLTWQMFKPHDTQRTTGDHKSSP